MSEQLETVHNRILFSKGSFQFWHGILPTEDDYPGCPI